MTSESWNLYSFILHAYCSYQRMSMGTLHSIFGGPLASCGVFFNVPHLHQVKVWNIENTPHTMRPTKGHVSCLVVRCQQRGYSKHNYEESHYYILPIYSSPNHMLCHEVSLLCNHGRRHINNTTKCLLSAKPKTKNKI